MSYASFYKFAGFYQISGTLGRRRQGSPQHASVGAAWLSCWYWQAAEFLLVTVAAYSSTFLYYRLVRLDAPGAAKSFRSPF
jgi:hypothetical protein